MTNAGMPVQTRVEEPQRVQPVMSARGSAAMSARSQPAGRPGFFAGAERPVLPEEQEESRAERRKRRQAELTALLGRLEGESAEEYQERMRPFVTMALAGPRSRVAEARQAAEQAAEITGEQRARLDQVIADAHQEAITLANHALTSGDLTPYSRNWPGVLNVAGGMGVILESTEGRIKEILSPEQVRILYDQGFEWGEYLGITVPWEQLDAPPPPPGG